MTRPKEFTIFSDLSEGIMAMIRTFFSSGLLALGLFLTTHGQAMAQAVPTCPEPGSVVIAWHSIAANARTYALIQLPTGINQDQAVALANRCRFKGRAGFLAEFGSAAPAEWQNVRSRFGNALRGQRVENIWVNARRERDGFVRWSLGRTSVNNIRTWNAWAPNEPQAKTAVTLHAGFPGLFNSCDAQDRYTRLLVEFR